MIADAPRVGDELAGRFRVEELCAQGESHAAVRATRIADGAEVLVFVAPPSTLAAQGVQRYAKHARPIRGLTHPRLLMVLDEGADASGAPWLATSFWPRETVAKRLARQGAINAHVAAAVTLDILSALSALHDRELAHRGVGARDVLLVMGDDGALHGHLLAGGVLRALACGPRPDDDTVRAASWAPEQWRGELGGPEADVWAVGVLLHRMLTGELPFEGRDARAVADHAASVAHANVGRATIMAVQRVIDRALEKRPEARYPDAGAMRAALEEAVAESGLAGSRPSAAPSLAPAPLRLPDETDDDLDALIASARSPSNAPPVVAPPTASLRPPSARPIFSDPPAAPAAPLSFDLDSVPAPPAATAAAIEIPRAPAMPNMPVAPSRPPPGVGAPGHSDAAAMQPTIVRGVARRESSSPKRPAVGAGSALLVVLAVTGVAAYLSRDFLERILMPRGGTPPELEVPSELPQPGRGDAATTAAWIADAAAVDASDDAEDPAEPAQPRVESQTPQVFGEQLRVNLPPGLSALQRQQFVTHLSTAAASERALRGFASCVDDRVFLHSGGVEGALREARVTVRCEGSDLALVADLDGDGSPDVAAIDARRGGLVIVGSRRMREERGLAVAGAWSLAAGLVAGEGRRREPAAAVYVVVEGAVPTLAAVGLRSGRVWWRADAALRVGAPSDHGLAVVPDADRDGTPDVVVGTLGAGRRCVTMLSGATGQPLWRAPRCEPGDGAQYLSAGVDTNDDGRPDVALGSAAGRRVAVLSGRDGRELVTAPAAATAPAERPFGQGLVLAPDLGSDGFADLAAPSTDGNASSIEVFSANDGHRIGAIATRYDGAPLSLGAVRVQYAEGFAFAQSRSLLVATPGGVVAWGVAPAPEERPAP